MHNDLFFSTWPPVQHTFRRFPAFRCKSPISFSSRHRHSSSMSFLPKHFFHDLWHAQLACLYYYAFVLLLACLLTTELLHQHKPTRALAGLVVTAALLIGQPFIYDSPTQTYGIGLASMCALGAWTCLHWSFMETKKRTVLQVCVSTITHPMSGVIKVFKRTPRQQQHARPRPQTPASPMKPSQRSSSRPLVVVDAAGDLHMVPTAGTAPVSHSNIIHRGWLAIKCLAGMLVVCVAYDIGLFLLCSLSNGMCSGPSGSGSSTATAETVQGSRFLALCTFGYMAGALLPLQMDIMFRCMRAGLLFGGCFVPALGDFADSMPSHAFNWPVASASISQLWGFRWHQFLRFYFEGMGYAAVNHLLPKGKAVSPGMRSSMHTVAAFSMSAIMHEYLTWAAFGTVTGCYLAFFGLHCVAVLLEGWAPFMCKAAVTAVRRQHQPSATSTYSRTSQDAVDTSLTPAEAPASSTGNPKLAAGTTTASKSASMASRWTKRVWAVAVMVLLSPLFVEPYRAAGYFDERAWHPFGAPVTPLVLNWAQQHLHAQLGFAEQAAVV